MVSHFNILHFQHPDHPTKCGTVALEMSALMSDVITLCTQMVYLVSLCRAKLFITVIRSTQQAYYVGFIYFERYSKSVAY